MKGSLKFMAKDKSILLIIGIIIAVALFYNYSGLFAISSMESYKAKILEIKNPNDPVFANYWYFSENQEKKYFSVDFVITDTRGVKNPILVCQATGGDAQSIYPLKEGGFSDGSKVQFTKATSRQLVFDNPPSSGDDYIAVKYPGKLKPSDGVIRFDGAVLYLDSGDPGFMMCQLYSGGSVISDHPSFIYGVNWRTIEEINRKY